MRRRRSSAVGLLAALGLAAGGLTGCSSVMSAGSIQGVRSDPDHQGLVVSYLGGGCDGPVRLKLKETPTRIDADLVMGPGGGGTCAAVGYPRTVTARLAQPIGKRTIWSGGDEQIPFDGADLLVPTDLPQGFAAPSESGDGDGWSPDPEAAVATSTWTTQWSPEKTAGAAGECRPTRGELAIRLGPGSTNRYLGSTKVGTARIGAATASIYRLGSSRRPVGWAYVWTRGRLGVELASSATCRGDQPLDRTDLLRVARSLRPA
ncbi:hypothetical protein [uncultured Friedmanniella sp.]|uniref:hypothetical protein n=1 Tax=uncultured Friedmanniella sp. TaxID=335381 RepID=UPI0035CA8C42